MNFIFFFVLKSFRVYIYIVPKTVVVVVVVVFNFEFIFFFWFSRKFYMFRHMYSKQVFVIWTLFGFISVFLLTALLKLEITVSFFWLSLPVHSGSLKRIKYSKLYSLAHALLLNVFSALKGTRSNILLVCCRKRSQKVIAFI